MPSITSQPPRYPFTFWTIVVSVFGGALGLLGLAVLVLFANADDARLTAIMGLPWFHLRPG